MHKASITEMGGTWYAAGQLCASMFQEINITEDQESEVIQD